MAAYTYDDNTYSDLHKDTYGFRPGADNYRWWASATPDEKQAEWDRLLVALEATIEREKEGERLAHDDFEKRIAGVMQVGAKSRKQAVQWIYDSLDDPYDYEYADWSLGLKYGTFKSELAGV